MSSGQLHPIPDAPYTAAFGESRSSRRGRRRCRSEGPATRCPTAWPVSRVWVRASAGEVIIVAGEGIGAREVARHGLRWARARPRSKTSTTPRRADRDPLEREPRGRPSRPRGTFMELGEGARLYLGRGGGGRGAPPRDPHGRSRQCWPPCTGAEAVDRALGTRRWPGASPRATSNRSSCMARRPPPGPASGTPPGRHSLLRRHRPCGRPSPGSPRPKKRKWRVSPARATSRRWQTAHRRGGGAVPAAAAEIRARAGDRRRCSLPGRSAGIPPRHCGSCCRPKSKAGTARPSRTKRSRAHFPAGKTFESWSETRSSIPSATQRALKSLEWVTSGRERRGGRATGHGQVPSARSHRPSRRRPGPVRGLVLRRGPRQPSSAATESTTPCQRPSPPWPTTRSP